MHYINRSESLLDTWLPTIKVAEGNHCHPSLAWARDNPCTEFPKRACPPKCVPYSLRIVASASWEIMEKIRRCHGS